MIIVDDALKTTIPNDLDELWIDSLNKDNAYGATIVHRLVHRIALAEELLDVLREATHDSRRID